MADEKQSGTETVRMVKCVKLGRELPGLDRVPWQGEIGKRVYENVSKEAWAMWVNHSKMLLNEFRLNPMDPQLAENHGRTDGAILLRRRLEAPRRLRRPKTLIAPPIRRISQVPRNHIAVIECQSMAPVCRREQPCALATFC